MTSRLSAMFSSKSRRGLLDLPLEVRLQILEQSIAVRRPIPSSPLASQDRVLFRNRHDSLWTDKTNIYLDNHGHAKSAQLPLLTTNHQLREETLLIIERVSNEPYCIDIMYVNQCGLMPTWVSLPCLQRRVGVVHAGFRTFDLPDGMNPEWLQNAHFPGPGDGTIRTGWNTMVFFTHYLLRACSSPDVFDTGRAPSNDASPVSEDRCDIQEEASRDTFETIDMGGERNPSNKWCTVDTLTINIEAQDMPNVLYGDEGRNVFGHSTFLGSDEWPGFEVPPAGVPNPRYGPAYKLARDMCASFQLMTAQNFPYAVYGELLHANVGKIEILVNGVTYERIDVVDSVLPAA